MPFVEHVAVRVRDIRWHIRFFEEALDMPVEKVDGAPDEPRQVWTAGGVQLMSEPSFEGPEGRLAHLGIAISDLEGTLLRVQAWGVNELPQGRNWFALPDGLSIELIQEKK